MFGDIGAVMIDEAIERDVRERVKSHLAGSSISAEDRAQLKGLRSLDISLYNDDWDKILVQYRALGLIDKGQKKRTVTDTHKYLSLTDKGDRHLTYLRAVRRDRKHDS